MEKVADRMLNYKFSHIPSAIANCAQRQLQHAAERGVVYYNQILDVIKKDKSIRLLKKEAQAISEIFERYINTTNTYYMIDSVDDSGDEAVVVTLTKMSPIS